MRDLLIASIVFGMLPFVLKRPFWGILLSAWLGYMNPHLLCYGFMQSMPVVQIVAIATLIGMLASKEAKRMVWSRETVVLVIFIMWMGITTTQAFYLEAAVDQYIKVMKIQILTFMALLLLTSREKVDLFVWVIVLSLGFYGVKGGVFTIANGGSYRVQGPGGFIGGNNELALALIMMIPLMRYLQLQSPSKWIRRGLVCAMALSAIAAIGTYSRGALLGMTGMLLFFVWRSDRKFVWASAIILFAVLLLPLMPDTWWERMGTIRTYGEDNSAQGRLTAWTMAWNLAQDRLMGGGFMVALPFVYAIYAPEATTSLVAHSIYFQIMGEHGFIGLFLFMLVGVLTWLDAAKLRRTYAGNADLKWAADLGSMMQVSMIGFAVTGAFLSMAYFDLPYNVMAISALALRIASREAAKGAAARNEESAPSPRPEPAPDRDRYDRAAVTHESASVRP